MTDTRMTTTVNSDRLVVDMSKDIAKLQPDKAPLVQLLNQLEGRSSPTGQNIFHWMEDDLLSRWDAINNGAGYTDSDTALVVDTGSLFNQDDIVKVPSTDEIMLVTAVNTSTNTITVTRGYADTTAAALSDNDKLLILGNAKTEAGSALVSRTTNVTTVYNYTQIFDHTVEISGTAANSDMYGGDDRVYQRKKKAIEHAVDIERSFLFGERYQDTSGSKPRRTTGGLMSFLTSAPTYNPGGAMAESDFEEWLEEVFRYGNDTKLLLGSPRIITYINSWARSSLETVPSDKTYGISLKKYMTPHGTLLLKKHDLFEQDYSGTGVVIDTGNIRKRPHKGRDTKLKTNIQPDTYDGYMDQYFTEAGLEVKLPKTHAVIEGVS